MKRSLACLALTLALASPVAAQTSDPAPADPAADPPLPSKPEAEPREPARQAPPPADPFNGPKSDAPAPSSPSSAAPLGVVVSADLGGGGRLGGGSEFTPRGVFEGEVTAGYDLVAGFRPEVSVLLGVTPRSYVGLRLGVHYALPDMPFYVRAAVDGSTVRGPARWRWLLAGAGTEVQLTDVLGGFAEADLGLPLTSGAGLPEQVRAGITFRL
ncbi:MAG: hypothetical protein ACJ79E_19320 [Anaeromyxobacteraceae bacterium]